MPFLTQDEEELRKEQGAPQISGQSSVINAPMAPQKQGAPASSGQFKNIQTYLDVNKEQAKQMGQNIVGSAQQAAQEASSAQEAFKAAKPQETQGQTAETLTQSYYSNPNANKQEYQTLKSTGGYSGPSSYLDMATYGTAQEKTQKAAEKVGQLQNQTGFEQAVAQQYSRPQYGQGAKRLDAALIRGEDSSKKEAEKTYQQWGNLQDLLNQSVDPVQQQIQKNLDTAYANKQLIGGPQGAEQRYVDAEYQKYLDRAAEQNKSNIELRDRLKADLQDNVLSQETISLLGLTPGTETYGLNLADLLRFDETTLQAKDVVTADERSNWQNLMNLIDRTDSSIGESGTTLTPPKIDRTSLNATDAEVKTIAKNTPITGFAGIQEKLGNVSDFWQSGMTPEQYVRNRYSTSGADLNSGYVRDSMNEAINFLNNFISTYKIGNRIEDVTDTTIKTPSGSLITGGLKG